MSTLPHRDRDPILTLHAHYFVAAELMLKNHLVLKAKRRKLSKSDRSDLVDETIYLMTWLGFLAVACEGFKRLRVRLTLKDRPSEFDELIRKADAIGKAIKIHNDDLRKLRNTIFHVRTDEDVESIAQFFGTGRKRIDWARNIQNDLADFFSKYRVNCEVHYIKSGREDERMMGLD